MNIDNEIKKCNDLCGAFSKIKSGNEEFKRIKKFVFAYQKELIRLTKEK